jgi:hypothetical protein
MIIRNREKIQKFFGRSGNCGPELTFSVSGMAEAGISGARNSWTQDSCYIPEFGVCRLMLFERLSVYIH